MGVANRELYLTNTNDVTGKVLLSAWIPEKREDGLYYTPKDTPIGLDLWVPNTLGVTYEEGPVPVKVVPSDTETGMWIICVNDYFWGEQHLFTTKPIHKKEEDRFHDYKGWRDWEFPDKNEDNNGGFSLHVYAPDVKHQPGDEPICVTFERGHAENGLDGRLEWKGEELPWFGKKECWLKRLFKRKKK
jgi:hypothetical protein